MVMTVREQLATRAHVDTSNGRARITLVGEGGGERELLLSDEAAWQILHGLVVHLRMTTRPDGALDPLLVVNDVTSSAEKRVPPC